MTGDQASPGRAVRAPEVWQALPYPRKPQEDSARSISSNKVRGGVSMLVMSSMFSYPDLSTNGKHLFAFHINSLLDLKEFFRPVEVSPSVIWA